MVDRLARLDALLDAGRTPQERRLERLRTADRLRGQAEQGSGDRRALLLESALRLEARAGRAELTLIRRT